MSVENIESRFTERVDLLDFLLDVSQVTSETLDLDRILVNVSEIVKEVIPHDLFAILLYTEKTRSLKIRYAIGHRDEITRSLVIQLGEGLTGIAAQTRKAIRVDDVSKEERYLNALDAVQAALESVSASA